jgi:hypothetical protein
LIKALANKRIDLSSDEFSYYKLLSDKYGSDVFRSLFETDQNGIITSVTPPLDGQTPMAVIFYMLNVMFAQRMRILDARLDALKVLEEKVDQLTSVAKLSVEEGNGKN